MSQTSHEPQRVPITTDRSIETLRAPLPTPARRPSHTWQNWTYFGAAIMGLLGASWALLGMISLVEDERPAFRVNRQGESIQRLAGDTPGFTRVAISREPAPGSPEPSGDFILEGTLAGGNG